MKFIIKKKRDRKIVQRSQRHLPALRSKTRRSLLSGTRKGGRGEGGREEEKGGREEEKEGRRGEGGRVEEKVVKGRGRVCLDLRRQLT